MNNKSVFIAGGSGVIGSAIARKLAADDFDVTISYRSGKNRAIDIVNALQAGGHTIEARQLDLEDSAATRGVIADTFEQRGRLDAVVYAAGPSIKFQLINQIEPAEWARVMNADANSSFNLVSAALPYMRQQKSGAFLAVLTAAVDRSPPRDILSAAPKAAIQMLFRSLALEEGRNGIRANCVAPGYILDGMGTSMLGEHDAGFAERMIKAIPLKRTGEVSEVAAVAAFLLSDNASYVTGSTIHVAGGLNLA